MAFLRVTRNPFDGADVRWAEAVQRIPDAVHEAGSATGSHVVEMTRRRANRAGWPQPVTQAMKVIHRMNPDTGYHDVEIGIEGDEARMAQRLEYGDEIEAPRPVTRIKRRQQRAINEHFSDGLKRFVFEGLD